MRFVISLIETESRELVRFIIIALRARSNVRNVGSRFLIVARDSFQLTACSQPRLLHDRTFSRREGHVDFFIITYYLCVTPVGARSATIKPILAAIQIRCRLLSAAWRFPSNFWAIVVIGNEDVDVVKFRGKAWQNLGLIKQTPRLPGRRDLPV